ncbi:chitotriosidase-1-like isoform X2 [Ixodes scapularis]
MDAAGPQSKQPDLDASPLGLAGLREILQRKLVSIPVLAWVGGHISDAGDFSRITSTSTDQTVQFTVAVEPWLGTNGLSGLHLDWRYSGGSCGGSSDISGLVKLVDVLTTALPSSAFVTVGLPYQTSRLSRGFDISSLVRYATLLIVGSHKTSPEEIRGQPRCPGQSIAQVAATISRLGKMAGDSTKLRAKVCYGISMASGVHYPNPQNLDLPGVSSIQSSAEASFFVPGAHISYADHCHYGKAWRRRHSNHEPDCTVLLLENVDASRLITYASAVDLAERMRLAYDLHDIGHICVAVFDMLKDDPLGRCGEGSWPLVKALL